MYQEDYINDCMNDDFDEPKSKKQLFEDMKKADKGYYSWTRPVHGSRKSQKIEAYSSGDVGSRIRDPITGERYRGFLVGSKNEDLFFKVKMATGEFGGREGPTLFYASPEEYEKHAKTFVSDEIKQRWYAKKSAADSTYKKDSEESDITSSVVVH
jgi:hypothetical protein